MARRTLIVRVHRTLCGDDTLMRFLPICSSFADAQGDPDPGPDALAQLAHVGYERVNRGTRFGRKRGAKSPWLSQPTVATLATPDPILMLQQLYSVTWGFIM